MKMESFLVLGAGRFGSLAVQRILAREEVSRLVVVDRDVHVLEKLTEMPIEIVEQDAIDFLVHSPGHGSDWIVPAVPVHVAFVWLCRQLAQEGTITPLAAPSALYQKIPNPMRGKAGTLYTSFATFHCPDDCKEPEEMCRVTQERRETNLYDLIQQIEVQDYKTLVVRSHQLTPGVGGYQFLTLWQLLDAARSAKKNIIVSTACRCHGVINALRFTR
jgi:threonine dehydrogenase-like Zn-dependent dehydrogenase